MSAPVVDQLSRTAVGSVPARPSVRVLHLINGEHYSGAERVQDLLALRLGGFGFDVGFVCLKPDRFPKMRRAQSAPLFEVAMRNRFDWSCARRVQRIVEEHHFQLLHAHTPRSLVIGRQVAARTGLPLVYHVHSPVGRDSTRGWRNRLNLWIETRSLKRIDRMICVSQSIGRYMESLGHDARKISVVHNGVPCSDHTRTRVAAGGEWTIGMVALFRPRKGIEILLEAISQLRKQRLPARLLAVGPFETPEYEHEIKRRVDELQIANAVAWTGFCKDVDAKLLEMDAFVLPSLFGEGLPMVVLEAMAVGVPVVASRVEGTPEAVRDGIDGLIFEPGSAEDLTSQLHKLISGQAAWTSLSQNAQARQRERFSDESMARGVAEAYRKVLAGKFKA